MAEEEEMSRPLLENKKSEDGMRSYGGTVVQDIKNVDPSSEATLRSNLETGSLDIQNGDHSSGDEVIPNAKTRDPDTQNVDQSSEVKSQVIFRVLLACAALIASITFSLIATEKMNFGEKENVALTILMSLHIAGTISVFSLIIVRAKNEWNKDCIAGQEKTFLRIKLISLFIFGVCYLLHCGLYVWKYSVSGLNKSMGLANYSISLFHILLIIIYFAWFCERKDKIKCSETCLSVMLILFNTCTWLDALSTDFLFNMQLNSTLPTQNATSRVIESLEKIDPLLSSAIIGFSLLTTSLLCRRTADILPYSYLQLNNPSSTDDPAKDNVCTKLSKKCTQTGFLLMSFGLFAFTFTELSIGESSADLVPYITAQFTVKLIILIQVFVICVCFFCKLKRICSSCEACREPINIQKLLCNVWVVMLIMTFFCNISYHVLCCICIRDLKYIQTEDYLLVDNIVDFIIAVFQISFILANYIYYDRACKNCNNLNKCVKWIFNKGAHILYSLLCILNMGLWISDSIRDKRLIYKARDNNDFFTLSINILFFISIFFRFQISFEFLKLYLRK